MKEHPGYVARNEDRNNLIRIISVLSGIKHRIQKRKGYYPLWIIEELDRAMQMSDSLLGPITRYRDELPKILNEE